jgi:PleD family two-component response regulator
VHTLLITGDRQAAVANALSDGSLEILVKPVQPEPLRTTIRKQLGPQFGV